MVASSVVPRYIRYPVTPTLSVAAVQFTVMLLEVRFVNDRGPGVEGGCVSGVPVSVVTVRLAAPDRLPAASVARTVYWYWVALARSGSVILRSGVVTIVVPPRV